MGLKLYFSCAQDQPPRNRSRSSDGDRVSWWQIARSVRDAQLRYWSRSSFTRRSWLKVARRNRSLSAAPTGWWKAHSHTDQKMYPIGTLSFVVVVDDDDNECSFFFLLVMNPDGAERKANIRTDVFGGFWRVLLQTFFYPKFSFNEEL